MNNTIQNRWQQVSNIVRVKSLNKSCGYKIMQRLKVCENWLAEKMEYTPTRFVHDRVKRTLSAGLTSVIYDET